MRSFYAKSSFRVALYVNSLITDFMIEYPAKFSYMLEMCGEDYVPRRPLFGLAVNFTIERAGILDDLSYNFCNIFMILPLVAPWSFRILRSPSLDKIRQGRIGSIHIRSNKTLSSLIGLVSECYLLTEFPLSKRGFKF